MSASSFAGHFNLWRLRRLLSSIRRVERDVINEQRSIASLVEDQTGDAQRHRLEEFNELVLDDETERLRCLKTRAFKVYQTLRGTPFGKELLASSGMDLVHLQFTTEAQESEQLLSPSGRPPAQLFGAFQLSWRIVQATIAVALLCFGLAAVFSAIGLPSPIHLITNLGALCLALTVIAAVAHSAIGLIAAFADRKHESILPLLIVWLFEVAFIALCSFFAFQLLKAVVNL